MKYNVEIKYEASIEMVVDALYEEQAMNILENMVKDNPNIFQKQLIENMSWTERSARPVE